jgi:hypothetical protein
LLPLEGDLANAMAERVRRPFDADWQSDRRSVIIRVQLPDGVLHVEAPRKRLFTGTLYLFFIWLVGLVTAAVRRRRAVHEEPGPRHPSAGRRGGGVRVGA